MISAHTFAYISLDAMILQEADQTHIEYGFPVHLHDHGGVISYHYHNALLKIFQDVKGTLFNHCKCCKVRGGDPILDLSGMLVTFGGLKFRILVTLRVSERSW